jgi:hypothetical protein
VSLITQADERDRKRALKRQSQGKTSYHNIHALPLMFKAADKVKDNDAATFAAAFTPTRSNHPIAKKLGLPLDVQRGRWVRTDESVDEIAMEAPVVAHSGQVPEPTVRMNVPITARIRETVVAKVREMGGKISYSAYSSGYTNPDGTEAASSVGVEWPTIEDSRSFEAWFNDEKFKHGKATLWLISEAGGVRFKRPRGYEAPRDPKGMHATDNMLRVAAKRIGHQEGVRQANFIEIPVEDTIHGVGRRKKRRGRRRANEDDINERWIGSIKLKDNPTLKAVVKRGFPKYRKTTVLVIVDSGPVSYSGYWDEGSRDEAYTLIPGQAARVNTKGHKGSPSQFGGGESSVDVPANGAAAVWGASRGKSATLKLYVHPTALEHFGLTGNESFDEAKVASSATNLNFSDQVDQNRKHREGAGKATIDATVHAWASKKFGKGNGVSITSAAKASSTQKIEIHKPKGRMGVTTITVTPFGDYIKVHNNQGGGMSAKGDTKFFMVRESVAEAVKGMPVHIAGRFKPGDLDSKYTGKGTFVATHRVIGMGVAYKVKIGGRVIDQVDPKMVTFLDEGCGVKHDKEGGIATMPKGKKKKVGQRGALSVIREIDDMLGEGVGDFRFVHLTLGGESARGAEYEQQDAVGKAAQRTEGYIIWSDTDVADMGNPIIYEFPNAMQAKKFRKLVQAADKSNGWRSYPTVIKASQFPPSLKSQRQPVMKLKSMVPKKLRKRVAAMGYAVEAYDAETAELLVEAMRGTAATKFVQYRLGSTKSGKKIPGLNDPVYAHQRNFPKWNVPVSVSRAGGSSESGTLIREMFPDWTKQDHKDAATAHVKAADKAQKAHSKLWKEAFSRTYGRPPKFHEFRISGVGDDGLDEKDKQRLRALAMTRTMHMDLEGSHIAASKKRNLTT